MGIPVIADEAKVREIVGEKLREVVKEELLKMILDGSLQKVLGMGCPYPVYVPYPAPTPYDTSRPYPWMPVTWCGSRTDTAGTAGK